MSFEIPRLSRPVGRAMSRATIAAAAAVCAVCALALSPQPATAQAADALTAGQFRLVDANGRYRGEMYVDAHGSARIVLTDAAGRVALTVGVDANGRAYILDARGQPLTAPAASPDLRLPPTTRVSPPPRGGGKDDAAEQSEGRAVRQELDAVWRQLQVLLDRVDLLSRQR